MLPEDNKYADLIKQLGVPTTPRGIPNLFQHKHGHEDFVFASEFDEQVNTMFGQSW
jgi:hypothetical protein